MAEKEFHCMECAGHAKAKGEGCSTCDGEGKQVVKKVVLAKPKKSLFKGK